MLQEVMNEFRLYGARTDKEYKVDECMLQKIPVVKYGQLDIKER